MSAKQTCRSNVLVMFLIVASVGTSFVCGCEGPTSSQAGELTGDGGRRHDRDPRHESKLLRSGQMGRRAIWNRAPSASARGDRSVRGTPSAATVGSAARSGIGAHTLVLYDSTGEFGFLGELYAMGTANLASHFGDWAAKPAINYACGEIENYTAMIYLGSTYDEPLPGCLLDDVLATTRPVIWTYFNFWQLTARAAGTFASRYGFTSALLDFSRFNAVSYKGRTLVRYPDNLGMLGTTISDPSRATELARAIREDGSGVSWAVRSGNLTFVAEIPFAYMSEEDRVIVFEDLLFDALSPSAPERHRALVRIEDIDPTTDPQALRDIADYLSAQGVPFGFGVIPEYRDPTGYYNDGIAETAVLRDEPELVAALRYMQAHGGVMLMHGRTHQWDPAPNPYTQVSGDDTEFFRVIENADHTLSFVGPLPEDSFNWAYSRIRSGERLFRNAQLATPTIFEFPHYTASANSYQAAVARIPTRWERSLYFSGQLSGGAIDHARWFGQLFPYIVRDVYGSHVLPENLGSVEPEPFFQFPMRFPPDIIRAAEKHLAIRDGVAGFYFHPFLSLDYLRECVDGIRALGYTFVDPNSL